VLGTIVPFAAWSARLRRLATRANLVGALLCVALVGAWPLLLFHDLGVDQVLATLRDTDLTTRRGGPLFYFTNVPVRMLPWVLLVPALFAWRGGSPEQRRSDAWRLSLCWFLAVFVPLQFSQTKHYRYLLPAYPAVALLLTALVHDERLGGWGRRLRDGVIGLVLALLLCAAVGAPIAAAVAGARSPIGPGLAALFALAVGAWAWLGVAALRRGWALRAFAFALCATSVVYAAEMAALALTYRERDATHVVRAAFVDPIEAGVAARSFGLDDKGEGLALIATRRFVPAAEDADAVAAWLRAEPAQRGVLMTTPEGAALLASDPRLSVSQRHEAELDRDAFVFLELRPSG
jgi:4-amino-4-deoxy-L-arabinose transferase-like glycosyltransferase